MKRFALITTLLVTLGLFSSCTTTDDAFITCDRYDAWLASCGNCSMTTACEFNYDTLAFDIQDELDYCADVVLMPNYGVCGPFTAGSEIERCITLGSTYLGIVCNWGPVCGDGTCDADETVANCPEDCGACGDYICDALEDPISCAEDCGYIVCDEYQIWLEDCFDDCTALETCDDEFATYWDDPELLEDLWECAHDLAHKAEDGMCVENYDSSCDILLEEYLGSWGECYLFD